MARKSVNLPDETIREIQELSLKKGRDPYGAMQDALARGAELVLAEMRGEGSRPQVTTEETEEFRYAAAFLRMLRSDDDRTRRMILVALEPWMDNGNRKAVKKTA